MATEFTKFLANKAKHGVAGSSKLKATTAGHIYNILIEEDLDNGSIVAMGDYVEPEVYKAAESTGFEGVIEDIAANGNFYVRVVNPGNALLVINVPLIYENYTTVLTDEANFFNAAGDIVRAYELVKGDIFEASAECFTGSPEKKATVTVTGKKLTIA